MEAGAKPPSPALCPHRQPRASVTSPGTQQLSLAASERKERPLIFSAKKPAVRLPNQPGLLFSPWWMLCLLPKKLPGLQAFGSRTLTRVQPSSTMGSGGRGDLHGRSGLGRTEIPACGDLEPPWLATLQFRTWVPGGRGRARRRGSGCGSLGGVGHPASRTWGFFPHVDPPECGLDLVTWGGSPRFSRVPGLPPAPGAVPESEGQRPALSWGGRWPFGLGTRGIRDKEQPVSFPADFRILE